MPLRPSVLVLSVIVLLFAIPHQLNAQSAKLDLSALPLAFERNQGQVTNPYQFFVRDRAVQSFFWPGGLDIFVHGSKSDTSRLRIRWPHSDSNTVLSGDSKLPGESNYFRGSDTSQWLKHVPQFAQIRYNHLYPGIDVLFYGRGDTLEHDFLLQPGANPSRVSFHLDRPAHLGPSGDLIVDIGQTQVRFLRPVAYQESGDSKMEVSAKFVIASNGDVRFKLGKYDHSKVLVIDPVFAFSTYLDGSNADSITGVASDASGNVYVTGYTASTDFPVTNGSSPLCSACSDASQTSEAFISKLDPTGHSLLYSTFLGGSTAGGGFGTFASSIALDKAGNIYVQGISSSHDFPHAGAVLPLVPGNFNTDYYFIASIKANGSGLNYSGLVGGAEGSYTNGSKGKMTVDANGNAYLAGTTYDSNFQLTPGTLDSTPTSYANDTMFVLKLDPAGKLVYSTLVPGSSPPVPGTAYANNFVTEGISVDAKGQVTAAGLAGLGLPTTARALQSTIPHSANSLDPTAGFVLQLNATASSLNFATYLPGTDGAGAMAVDSTGNIYVAGMTSETNLPVGPNSYQKSIVPNSLCTCDAGYIIKVDPLAQSVLAATYLSGSAGANFQGIAVDSKANVMVGGFAFGPDFPLKNPYVTTYQVSGTAAAMVLAELNTDLSALLFGSFLSSTSQLGGSYFSGVTFDPADHLIVAGVTFAADFPTTAGAFQPTPPQSLNPFSGYQHTFITKLDLATPAPSVCIASAIDFGPILVGTSSSLDLDIKNCGNADLQLSSAVSSVPEFVAGKSCSLITAGSTCNLQITFTPSSTSTFSGTLTLNDNAAIPRQTMSLSGKGGAPEVWFPPSFQANDLLVGTQGDNLLGFVNSGDGDWIVSNVTATGDFSIDNGCTAPVTPSILGGLTDSCVIRIIFSPTQVGLRTGTLTITDNAAGSPHIIPLTGNSFSVYATPSITDVIAIPTDSQPPGFQIRGNNFFPASQVLVNGTARTTHYVDESFLFADLNPTDIGQAGEVSVAVSNPSPGGGLSNAFTATIYTAIRNITFLHTVYDAHSGHLFSSVGAQSPNYPNQIVVIDPSTAKVLNAWTIGNGPNQLAVSDDGQFLYAGLDGDRKVAQVALPAGTVNFVVGLGNDLDFQQPMVADAIRVLPGLPHSWTVSLCGVGFSPCGDGISVFDDAVQRPTFVSQNQLQPDALTFVGQDASTLYGTTLFQIPPTFYKFSITSNGISLSQTVTNYSGASPGGGPLDSDGHSIYVSNGQIVDPATLTIKDAAFPVQSLFPAFKVDVPASRVYFAGVVSPLGFPGYNYAIDAFDLTTQQLTGSIPIIDFISGQELYRWGSNGLAISSSSAMLLFRTSLTGGSVSAPQLFASTLAPSSVQAGSADLSLAISGGNFTPGDSVTANGIPIQISAVTATQITTTIPAAILSVAGDVQIAVTDPSNQVAYLVLIVSAEPTSIKVSTNQLAFPAQIVGTSSASQTITLSNTGNSAVSVSGIAVSGDFSQTNNCMTLAATASCSIAVVFQPTQAGNRVGVLTVSDSDVTKSQTVTLGGIGSDVQIGGASSGTSATVASGQPANYSLIISPEGGFTGQVSFSCSNLPKYSSCNFNPSNANLGSTPLNVTVTITTSQQQSAYFHNNVGPLVTLASLAMFFLLPLRRPGQKGKIAAVQLIALALMLSPLQGCGSASSSAPPPAPPAAPSVTPSGTYTVNFVVSNAQVSRSVALTLVVR